MKKSFLILISCCLPLFASAQNNWDAVTAEEILEVVLDDCSEINNLMAHNGYEVVNNLDTNDGGFLTIYSRNCTLDLNGNAVRLGKGVSSEVLCLNPLNMESSVSVVLFSTANANKFRQQVFDLGFKKSKTTREGIYYKIPGYQFVVFEAKGKSGRYPVTGFTFLTSMPE